MRRAFLTGFKGSAGTAVLTNEEALLWTDSRYWNEAKNCLEDCWTLQKAGLTSTLTIPKWLAEKAVQHYKETSQPLIVGMDPFVHAASFAKEIQDAWKESAASEFNDENLQIGRIDTAQPNLIDQIWGDARPAVPTNPFKPHPMKYAGCSWEDKVEKVREEMVAKKASFAVFPALDDVAYLLNVRAQGDVETCPIGIAYVIVSANQVLLYCDPAKLQLSETQEHLKGVTLRPYDDVVSDIASHCSADSNNKVWLDKSRCNYALVSIVPEKQLIDAQNAVVPMKACKNEAELQGMRDAHIADGVAMAEFMAWLEDTIVVQGKSVSEVDIDLKLTGCRAKQPGFKEVSFPTIAGVGPNGAIIHYRATPESSILKYLDKSNPILIDSGGQYEYGTTDVTRTWHFGEPSEEFREYFTRVLKGHIGLDRMIFPENTPGFVLDVYARQPLWDVGKDYGHGTGHGVGAALNVHEGPMSISPRWANKEVLKQGMVVSNEPGYYEDGNFGIRIENLVEIQYIKKYDENHDASGDKKFLKFKKLTKIPIQKNLVKIGLMSKEELDWLDDYHKQVFDEVAPLIHGEALEWLKKSCEKIDRSGS